MSYGNGKETLIKTSVKKITKTKHNNGEEKTQEI